MNPSKKPRLSENFVCPDDLQIESDSSTDEIDKPSSIAEENSFAQSKEECSSENEQLQNDDARIIEEKLVVSELMNPFQENTSILANPNVQLSESEPILNQNMDKISSSDDELPVELFNKSNISQFVSNPEYGLIVVDPLDIVNSDVMFNGEIKEENEVMMIYDQEIFCEQNNAEYCYEIVENPELNINQIEEYQDGLQIANETMSENCSCSYFSYEENYQLNRENDEAIAEADNAGSLSATDHISQPPPTDNYTERLSPIYIVLPGYFDNLRAISASEESVLICTNDANCNDTNVSDLENENIQNETVTSSTEDSED